MNSHQNTIMIAIDGPAGSGKGVLARHLAAHYRLQWIDSGLMYRAIAIQLGNRCWTSLTADEQRHIIAPLRAAGAPSESHPAIRHESTAQKASMIAQTAALRTALLPIQRARANNPPAPLRGSVMDGRDIGTDVLPHTPYKIYLTASLAIRAKRRYKELHNVSKTTRMDDVMDDMSRRDAWDRERPVAPLRKAKDALTIDSTHMDEEETWQTACRLLKTRGLERTL